MNRKRVLKRTNCPMLDLTMLLCLVTTFLLSAGCAYAKEQKASSDSTKSDWTSVCKLPEQHALNSFITPMMNGAEGTLIIAFTDGKHHVCRAYGDASRTADQDTIFEIGSITKVFTSLLMIDLWKDGKLNLDDPVEKFLPQDVVVPKLNGKSITLFQLATHTSGLPANPDNLDRYQKYGKVEFHEFLSRCKLESAPGSKYSYSNTGYRLLGEALEFALQKPYEEALTEHILNPLQLDDTRITVPEEKISRLAQGYGPDGKKVPNSAQTGGPAGGLKSTAENLLSFLDAAIAAPRASVPKAGSPDAITDLIAESCKHRFEISRDLSSCLGWLRSNREDCYYKNGQIHGFSTCVEFSARKRFGMVVLSSTLQINAEALLKKLRKRFN